MSNDTEIFVLTPEQLKALELTSIAAFKTKRAAEEWFQTEHPELHNTTPLTTLLRPGGYTRVMQLLSEELD